MAGRITGAESLGSLAASDSLADHRQVGETTIPQPGGAEAYQAAPLSGTEMVVGHARGPGYQRVRESDGQDYVIVPDDYTPGASPQPASKQGHVAIQWDGEGSLNVSARGHEADVKRHLGNLFNEASDSGSSPSQTSGPAIEASADPMSVIAEQPHAAKSGQTNAESADTNTNRGLEDVKRSKLRKPTTREMKIAKRLIFAGVLATTAQVSYSWVTGGEQFFQPSLFHAVDNPVHDVEQVGSWIGNIIRIIPKP